MVENQKYTSIGTQRQTNSVYKDKHGIKAMEKYLATLDSSNKIHFLDLNSLLIRWNQGKQ